MHVGPIAVRVERADRVVLVEVVGGRRRRTRARRAGAARPGARRPARAWRRWPGRGRPGRAAATADRIASAMRSAAAWQAVGGVVEDQDRGAGELQGAGGAAAERASGAGIASRRRQAARRRRRGRLERGDGPAGGGDVPAVRRPRAIWIGSCGLAVVRAGVVGLDLEQLDADEPVVGRGGPAGRRGCGPRTTRGSGRRRPGPGASRTRCSRSGGPARRGSGSPTPWCARPRRRRGSRRWAGAGGPRGSSRSGPGCRPGRRPSRPMAARARVIRWARWASVAGGTITAPGRRSANQATILSMSAAEGW